MNVFQKLLTSHERGTSATLSHADVSFLFETLGDAIGRAEAEYEMWRDRLAEYERNLEREAAQEGG